MTMKNDKPATRINGYEIAPDADLRSADLRGAELDYANLSHLSSQDKHSGRKTEMTDTASGHSEDSNSSEPVSQLEQLGAVTAIAGLSHALTDFILSDDALQERAEQRYALAVIFGPGDDASGFPYN